MTFPDALRRREVDGEPVAYLDASLAGLVGRYLDGGVEPSALVDMDEVRQHLLSLRSGLPGGEARDHVSRLVAMATLILRDP